MSSAAPKKPATPAKKPATPAKKPATPAKKPATKEEADDGMNDEIDILTPEEHLRDKDMWGGALVRTDVSEYLQGAWINPEFSPEEEPKSADGDADDTKSVAGAGDAAASKYLVKPLARHHTPVIFKAFDEIIVNANDYERSQRKSKNGRVTYIKIGFDPETARFSVENDGPGIAVEPHEKATALAQKAGEGRAIYLPEVCFAVIFGGSNTRKALANIKGGTNGIGAKLANVSAEEFEIETVDSKGRYYYQKFENRLRVKNPPVIIDGKTGAARGKPEIVGTTISAAFGDSAVGANRKPHTRVAFIPAFAELGYGGKTPFGAAEADDVVAHLRLRAIQAATYAGPKVRVTFNGEELGVTSIAALARVACSPLGANAAQAAVLATAMKPKEPDFKPHPWDVAVAILPAAKGAGAVGHMTILNGVICNRGSHITYLKKILSDAVVDKISAATKSKGRARAKGKAKAKAVAPKGAAEKKLGVADTMKHVRFIVCGALPGARWSGQRKDELSVEQKILANYEFSAAFLKEAAALIAERILSAEGKRKRSVPEKYVKAKKAGGALSAQCALFAAEGDSALAFLRQGLAQNKKGERPKNAPKGYVFPSTAFCGSISLGGVTMNAMREVKEVETSQGADPLIVRSEKLRNNKVLRSLVDAWGLEFGKTYESPEERAKLAYGALIGCTDQDLDGIGKILSLVLVFVHTFWPALIKHGCVGKFLTPVIRAFPKKGKGDTKEVKFQEIKMKGGKIVSHKNLGTADRPSSEIIEFQYENELREWLKADPTRADRYTIQFYKGLAGHEDDDVRLMFQPERFNRMVYYFTLDDAARENFRVFFGPDAKLRKAELATPVAFPDAGATRALARSRALPCTHHLKVDTKAFKLDAIRRQIPHADDGIVPARRKIVDGCLAIFGRGNRALKVFMAGGRIAAERSYHHGDASLNATIIKIAQSYPGARQFPYLIGRGQFGTRYLAGKDHGSARYIGIQLCPITPALFRAEDRWLLPIVEEDGKLAEPVAFVPPYPMAIMESLSIPSEGWSHDSYARDPADVDRVLDRLLAGDEALAALADRLREGGPTPELLKEVRELAAEDKELELGVSRRDFTGDILTYRDKPYSTGMYEIAHETDKKGATRATVRVTDLPIGMSTDAFIKSLTKPRAGGEENKRAAFIEEIDDDCGENDVDVSVRLRPGAYETILDKFGDAVIDPITDFLGLRDSIQPHLNYIGRDGTVLEFGDNYLAVMLYWFPARRDLYALRLRREETILRLRILEQENILRYIPLNNELDISKMEDEDAAAALLAEHEFPVLDAPLLHAPKFTPVAELEEKILRGAKASYGYLLELSDRARLGAAVKKREAELAKLRAELEAVAGCLSETPFAGVSIWRAELAEFRKLVAKGLETRWKFKKGRGDSSGGADDAEPEGDDE